MKSEESSGTPESRIAQEASAWVLRCDRGLTPAEQDEFSDWLAADRDHGPQLARQRQYWQRLNGLAQWRPEHSDHPNPDLLAPPRRARVLAFAPWVAALAAAAAVTIGFFWKTPTAGPAPGAAVASSVTTRALPDGTRVVLNHGAELAVEFTPGERRVRLTRGEAHFAVTKDPARPFMVRAGGIDVRAVGTAFNVRLGAGTVEVLVTEGRVGVAPGATGAAAAARSEPPLQLAARQRVVVSLAADAPSPQVATLTTGEIDRVLAWQHRLLDFTAAPLGDVVAEFNRHNVVQIVVADPELAATRISATFRTDNIDGFIHLLEAGFGATAERKSTDEVVLRRASK